MRSDRKDAVYERARAKGYRARSAYKLIDLDDRHRFLRRSRRILDVGSWPGGWLQVAAERSGPEARIVGVDLEPVERLSDPRVQCLTGDVTSPRIQVALREALDGQADLMLSDAAPKLTGIAATDDARLEELGLSIVRVAGSLLRSDGTLVMKIFTGQAGNAVKHALDRTFRSVKGTRPDSTRKGSSELYVLATGRK